MDRNGRGYALRAHGGASLSARRAWIEMHHQGAIDWAKTVALRKESVDRNAVADVAVQAIAGRSPQGERG